MCTSSAPRWIQASVAGLTRGAVASRRRLANPAPRHQPALLVGEIAAGVLGPRVAEHLLGPDAEAAAADILPLAAGASALEQRPAIAEAGEERIAGVLPDGAELPRADVA